MFVPGKRVTGNQEGADRSERESAWWDESIRCDWPNSTLKTLGVSPGESCPGGIAQWWDAYLTHMDLIPSL